MKKIPLPASLTGVTEERIIQLDTSLFYLVSGVLEYLCDKEAFEETGSLTAEDTKNALSDMLEVYFKEKNVARYIVGEYKAFAWRVNPDGWLICNGQAVSRTTYAELFALIGTNYNTGGESGTEFRVPDMQTRSPVGVVSGAAQPVGHYGAESKTLALTNVPPHNHQQTVNNTTPQVRFTAGGSTINTATGATSSSTTPLTTQNAGGSSGAAVPFDLYHPVQEQAIYIYAGI